jgi:hypothetical protein
MFTLNEMLILFFEIHAVGEYPTVLYKYIKKYKDKKQNRSVKKHSRIIQQAIQQNRNVMASLNLKIISQQKMLSSKTEILILFYTSLNLKIIFQLKSEVHYSILK